MYLNKQDMIFIFVTGSLCGGSAVGDFQLQRSNNTLNIYGCYLFDNDLIVRYRKNNAN